MIVLEQYMQNSFMYRIRGRFIVVVKAIISRNYLLTIVFASVFMVSFGMISHNAFADQVITTIPLGTPGSAFPWYLGINPNTNMIYVGQNGGNDLYIINGTTNTLSGTLTIGTTAIGTPSSTLQIAANPNTNKIYAINENVESANLVVIDGSTKSIVTKIPVRDSIEGLAVNPNTNKIYVGDLNFTVLVIDGLNNSIVAKIPVYSDPADIFVNPVTNKIYVAILHSAVVDVLDGSTNTMVNTIGVGVHPENVAVNSVTNRIFVGTAGTAYENPNLYVIDGSTNNVITIIPKLGSPTEMALNQNTNKVYVPYNYTISVINGSTNSVIGTVSDGSDSISASANIATNKIYVVNQRGNSVSVIDGFPVPSAPQNLQATGGNAQVVLSWSAPSNSGGSAITNYKVYRGTSSGSETLLATTGNVLSYTDNTAINGQVYFYKVSAVNSYGESALSNEASASPSSPTATAPQPQTGLTATRFSSYKINQSWKAPSDNGGAAIKGYKIERSNDTGSTWNIIVSNTGKTATIYSDTGLQATTTYTYRVSAINSVGTSLPSNTASATTISALVEELKFEGNTQDTSGYGNNGVNTGATFVPGKIGQALSFDGVSNVVNVPNSPSLNFGTAGSFSISLWIKSTQSGAGNAGYGLIVDHRRNNDGLYSGYSIEDSSGSLMGRIRDNLSHDVIVTSTTNVNDGLFHHIAFVVDRSTQTEKLYIDNTLQASQSIASVGSIDSAFDIDIGGTTSPNTAVNFYNGIIDQTRIYSKALSPSEIQTLYDEISPSPTVATAPQTLQASAGNAQVSLSWSAPSSNGGSAIINYKVYRGTSSGTETLLATTGNVLSYTDSTATNGQAYFFKVSAVNSVGESIQSNEASATPSAPLPTQVTISVKSVDLSGNPITGMSTVIRYTNGTTIAEGFTPVSFTVTSGITYLVHVRTYVSNVFNHWMDGSTNSYYTIAPTQNTVLTAYYSTGTTSPHPTTPSAPQNLQAAGGNAQASLSWSAHSSNGGATITNYKIYRSTSSGTETLLTTVGNVLSYT